MKTRHALPILCTCLLPALVGTARADQTISGNLTIQQGLVVGQNTNLYGNIMSFGHLGGNLPMPGFQLTVNQQETSTTQTNVLTPGYFNIQSVVVEDYGWLGEANYWYTDYGWVTVPDYYPAVYDTDGNLITEAYWGSHDEWQETGGHWGEYNYHWGITGTHTEQQETWVPDVVENVTLTTYAAPHVAFNASRSDTNYDFVFPSESGSGNLWTALSIYSGGLTMTSEDTSHSFALTPWSFNQSGIGPDNSRFSAGNTAEGTKHSYSWSEPGVGRRRSYRTESYMGATALLFTYREWDLQGNITQVRTQIAARSAQFAGVVTVEGNLNVKGTARMLPAGDLSMGAYHKGTKPDGTIDNGN